MQNGRIIRFIDSEYRELFSIPDGGSIKVTYPPGDSRGTLIRQCKYLDDYHFETLGSGSNIYHICEFAELMEKTGAWYEPEIQLQDAKVMIITPGEKKFFRRSNAREDIFIGRMTGNFGNDGERFNSNWCVDATQTESNCGYCCAEFQTELYSVVYALRQGLLKDYSSMSTYCGRFPEAELHSGNDYNIYGFKLETDSRNYFISCFLGDSMRDSRFTIILFQM